MKVYVILLFYALVSASTIEDKSVNESGFEEKINHKRNVYRFPRQTNTTSSVKYNKQYQPCVAFGNKDGYCRHFRHCPLEWTGINFLRIVDYLCVIENAAVGICCPLDFKISPVSAGANIVKYLPSVGSEVDTDETEKPNATIIKRGCGVQHYSRQRKTLVKDWPWMAALIDTENKLFCGGSLITDHHVLTAAHCTNRKTAQEIRVRLGEYDFSQTGETRPSDFFVVQINQHEDFEATTYDNDISVLKLNRRTTFNSYIWPICLPPRDLDYTDKIVTVTGWGRKQFGFNFNTSNVLMEVSMPVWEQERCARSFTQTITNNVICAAAYEGGKDACQGDSGGPLQYQLENDRWVIIGVVSWGIGCGDIGRPGIYTRVDKYLNWIIGLDIFT